MKKQQRNILLCLFAVFLFICSASAVHAAEIRQTAAAGRSVKITWDEPDWDSLFSDGAERTVTGYEVAWGKTFYSLTKEATVSGSKNSYVITGLSPYSKYCVRVYCSYKKKENGKEYEFTHRTAGLAGISVYTVPGIVSNINCSFTSNQKGFYIDWDAPSGDSYGANYQFMLTDINGKRMKSVRLPRRYFYSSTFKVTRVAKARIRAYVEINGQVYYGPWVTKNIVPQPIISTDKTKTYIKDGSMYLTWSKVTGAQSYMIYVSKSKDSGYKRVKTVSGSATGATLTKFNGAAFENNTYYYVIIVTKSAYGNSAKTYGATVRLSVY